MNPEEKTKEINRIELENKKQLFEKISGHVSEEERENLYRVNYQNLYYIYDLFSDKKSKLELEANLKEVDPYIKLTPQLETMMKGISKLFLMELFEEGVEVKGQLSHKKEIDEEVLEEAYRRLQNKNYGKEL